MKHAVPVVCCVLHSTRRITAYPRRGL